DAAQVHGHREIPVLLARRCDRTHVRRNARIADERVDTPTYLQCLRDECLDIAFVRYIATNADDLAPARTQLGGGLLARRRILAGDDDLRTCFRHTRGDRAPDAACGSSDQRNLTLEIEERVAHAE